MTIYEIFFWLLVAHCIADFPLQGDWLARSKNPNAIVLEDEEIWPWSMTAHCLIHAGAVFYIVSFANMPGVAAICATGEFTMHFLIDYHKCMGYIGYVKDQLYHVFMKGAHVAAIVAAAWVHSV